MKAEAASLPAYPRASEPGASAYFLVGPTAVGKTSVVHHLAVTDGLEILSADSMLVYRGMDVGTAKPSARERVEVRYWGLDLADPSDTFSAGAYLAEAAAALRTAAERGRPLLVTGGTGLYVTALVRGLDAGGAPAKALRERLLALQASEGVDGLRAELERLAPERLAALADPRNPRRLVRALEQAHETSAGDTPTFQTSPPRLAGLSMRREALGERIRARVDGMYEAGLLDEAQRLRAGGPDLSRTAREAIGYREAFAVLDGTMTEAEARERTVIRTRQLAKRQTTWFRHQAEVTWIDVEPGAEVEGIAEQVRQVWRASGPTAVCDAGRCREEKDGGEN